MVSTVKDKNIMSPDPCVTDTDTDTDSGIELHPQYAWLFFLEGLEEELKKTRP